jgi:pilus assembly protein CpaC
MNSPLNKALLFCSLVLFTSLANAHLISAQENATVIGTSGQQLNVETSQGLLIRLDRPATNIFIANPAIADVQVKSASMVYVFGKEVGETSLYALDDSERVIYSSKVRVSQNLSRIEDGIRSLVPSASIKLESMDGLVAMTGFAQTPAEAETAMRIVRRAVGDKTDIINQVEIATPMQVNLRVKIAEVGKGVMKELGFNWDGTLVNGSSFFGIATGNATTRTLLDPITNLPVREFITRGEGANSIFGNFLSGNFDLNGVIDALETEGFLSILAEPNLTALSGETASFLAGGEFPIPVPDEGDISIEFKEFGVGLSFTPRVTSAGHINLQVSPEVSQLSNNGAISINGISVPALTTRKASTTVELASGQSFAIAGLLQSSMTQDTEKFPILGDIPILGALFTSDRYQRKETELVIIVTPYIVRPVNAQHIALPTDGILSPSTAQRMLGGATQTYETRPQGSPDTPTGELGLVGGAGFRIEGN